MKRLIILINILCLGCISNAQNTIYQDKFNELNNQATELVFEDNFSNDWRNNWHLDGKKGRIYSGDKKLKLYAGKEAYKDENHVVLWTKKEFEGNLKIEYDFTRLDQATFVNILYIQAQGSGEGEFDKNIFKWNALREIPKMSMYYDNMDTYHISYSVGEDKKKGREEYIRGRRYMPKQRTGLKGTEMTPVYHNTGLFRTGVRYHLTFIKVGKEIYFNVNGDGQNRTFYFNAEKYPPIDKGRIGLRQMFTKASIYENFKIYKLKK